MEKPSHSDERVSSQLKLEAVSQSASRVSSMQLAVNGSRLAILGLGEVYILKRHEPNESWPLKLQNSQDPSISLCHLKHVSSARKQIIEKLASLLGRVNSSLQTRIETRVVYNLDAREQVWRHSWRAVSLAPKSIGFCRCEKA